MTIGFVLECGPQGADLLVCEYLARSIRPDMAFSSRTLDNKENLLRDAGKVAGQLLKDGCRCVLIVWDLRPSWPDKKSTPCRTNERQHLLTAIEQAGLPASAPVYLVCDEQLLQGSKRLGVRGSGRCRPGAEGGRSRLEAPAAIRELRTV
jgi:hypothetical protein